MIVTISSTRSARRLSRGPKGYARSFRAQLSRPRKVSLKTFRFLGPLITQSDKAQWNQRVIDFAQRHLYGSLHEVTNDRMEKQYATSRPEGPARRKGHPFF